MQRSLVHLISSYLQKDDDDREEFFYRIGEALVGLNLLYSVPYIGTGAQIIIAKAMDRDAYIEDVTNPFRSAAQKINKVIYDEDLKWYERTVIPFLELTFPWWFSSTVHWYVQWHSRRILW